MELVTKHPQYKNFWIENFNDEERAFFEKLGFKFVKSRMPKSFGGRDTLELTGTGVFGLWTKEELSTVLNAVQEKYGEVTIYQMDANE